MLNIIVGPLIVGLIIGVFVWFLGRYSSERTLKTEAIRNLMTYRGDYASDKFRQSLNAVSITFHKDKATRKQIRELYDLINSSRPHTTSINRKIVGLIYDLCRKNGFKGITEYDIDQSFPEQNQTPTGMGGSLAPAPSGDEPVDAPAPTAPTPTKIPRKK